MFEGQWLPVTDPVVQPLLRPEFRSVHRYLLHLPPSPHVNQELADNEYEVEHVIGIKYDRKSPTRSASRTIQYLVKWQEYEWSVNSWQAEKDILGCDDLLTPFLPLIPLLKGLTPRAPVEQIVQQAMEPPEQPEDVVEEQPVDQVMDEPVEQKPDSQSSDIDVKAAASDHEKVADLSSQASSSAGMEAKDESPVVSSSTGLPHASNDLPLDGGEKDAEPEVDVEAVDPDSTNEEVDVGVAGDEVPASHSPTGSESNGDSGLDVSPPADGADQEDEPGEQEDEEDEDKLVVDEAAAGDGDGDDEVADDPDEEDEGQGDGVPADGPEDGNLDAVPLDINGDHYEVLGVERDATTDKINRAFHVLSLIYHPDRLVGEPEKVVARKTEVFQRLNHAHRILSDPVEREKYDEEEDDIPDQVQEEEVEIGQEVEVVDLDDDEDEGEGDDGEVGQEVDQEEDMAQDEDPFDDDDDEVEYVKEVSDAEFMTDVSDME